MLFLVQALLRGDSGHKKHMETSLCPNKTL